MLIRSGKRLKRDCWFITGESSIDWGPTGGLELHKRKKRGRKGVG